jgi:F420-0:gamma-glutamyl ligase-like protein
MTVSYRSTNGVETYTLLSVKRAKIWIQYIYMHGKVVGTWLHVKRDEIRKNHLSFSLQDTRSPRRLTHFILEQQIYM